MYSRTTTKEDLVSALWKIIYGGDGLHKNYK